MTSCTLVILSHLLSSLFFFTRSVWFAYHAAIGTYQLIIPATQRSVAGEIVVISGAGHGVGKEIAKIYASLEATVICVDINDENNQQTVNEIKKEGYTEVYGYQCDIANIDEVFSVARKVQSEVGDPTILVNNAAIMPAASFLKYKPETVRRLMDVNILGHIWMLQAYLPSMIEKNKGHIVSISSLLGIIGMRNVVPYCATKFAIRGIMESLENEIGKSLTCPNSNLKFTAVYPYMIDSGLCEKPRLKFPNGWPLLSPKYVASEVVKAQRRNTVEVTLPKMWGYLNAWGRLLPAITLCIISDFIDSGLDVD